jgi:hypothetical protein
VQVATLGNHDQTGAIHVHSQRIFSAEDAHGAFP